MALPFPMTPAQAAALGMAPPPVAVVNGAQAPVGAGGFPMTPAQAAVLGAATASPVSGAALPVAGAPAATAGGAVGPSPMAAMLLARANRTDPIRSGVGLLGRLAAFGVGTKLEREERERQGAALSEGLAGANPEVAAMARLAVAMGGNASEVLSAMLTARGQDKSAATAAAGQQVTMRGQDLAADTAGRQLEANMLVSAAELSQKSDIESAKINASRDALAETHRANMSDEQIKRDRLEFDQSEAAAKRLAESAEGLELTEAQGKALSLVSQLAPALELLNDEQLRNYRPGPKVQGFIESLASYGQQDFAGVLRTLFKGNVYANMSEADQRFLTHGLTVADMALRDTTGASMNAGELATTFVRLLPMQGNTDELLDEKRALREAVLDGLLAKLPPGAIDKLAEVAGRE